MSDLALFIIGCGVFFMGGLGLVLYTLDTFQSWSLRENQDGEDNHLEDEQVHDVIKDPARRRH
jgi:hypothetical protein